MFLFLSLHKPESVCVECVWGKGLKQTLGQLRHRLVSQPVALKRVCMRHSKTVLLRNPSLSFHGEAVALDFTGVLCH